MIEHLGDQRQLALACWNTQWRRPGSWQATAMREALLRAQPELVCGAEAYLDFLSAGWHCICSRADAGYPIKEARRKVVLWSRTAWRQQVDDLGSERLPSGRFVSGVTQTSIGNVLVIGVCIPWPAAHVTTGRRDRKRWEEHLLYLRGLAPLLRRMQSQSLPTIIVGDFNQRMPRRFAPREAHQELLATLEGFYVWTTGEVPGLATQPVCHLAGSSHFAVSSVLGFPRASDRGELSDHDGLFARVALLPGNPSTTPPAEPATSITQLATFRLVSKLQTVVCTLNTQPHSSCARCPLSEYASYPAVALN